MKFSVFNLMIKEMSKQLIDVGHDLNSICRLTLGSTSVPLFQRLLDGKILGHLPLERFVDSFGYDLMIVPVKKDDTKEIANIEQKCFDFVKIAKKQLDEYLQNKSTTRRAKSSEVKEQLDLAAQNIIEKIYNQQ